MFNEKPCVELIQAHRRLMQMNLFKFVVILSIWSLSDHTNSHKERHTTSTQTQRWGKRGGVENEMEGVSKSEREMLKL